MRVDQPHGPEVRGGAETGVVGTLVETGPFGASATDARRGAAPTFRPSSMRAFTRLPVAGWVENRLSAPRPASGLMMNSCPEAGLRSAVVLTIRRAWLSIF